MKIPTSIMDVVLYVLQSTADPQYPSRQQMDVIDVTQLIQSICKYISPVQIRTLIECHFSVEMLSSAGMPAEKRFIIGC